MTFIEDINKLLEASFESVNMQLHSLKSVFPTEGPLSLKEASLGCLLHFMDILSRNLLDSFSYLESQIEKQICEALGKHIGPSDFDGNTYLIDRLLFVEYMRFHNRLFFAESQKPKPFSFPVRRVGHVPEGSISLESEDGIIHTIMSQSTELQQMFFALNESAKISFKGETYLHGYLRTNFDDSPLANLKLVAQTRQFSCFILLIGKLISRDQFEPETAIILQNKDILLIDILTEIIPSAKQFKKSISSLSPEQQRFAHAFRSMQLSSTLFALCVIQIKPALEKVLNLPIDALTKEITLTQDLLKLFIEYQIPSDLLSFDESLQNPSNLGVAEKISIVRTNTNRMLEIIDKEKENQIKEKALLDSYENEPQIQKKTARTARCLDVREDFMTRSAVPDPKAPFAPKVFASESYDPENTLEQAAQISPPEYASSSKSDIDDHKEYDQIIFNCIFRDLKNNFFMVPQKMDQLFEKYDVAGAVRPTILSAGDWTLKSFPSLLAEQTTRPISKDERKLKKNKAFDLIDALTKSGAIELDSASLHVIIAATHNFQNALMGVLVKENTNPIEKVQASSIIMASCIHDLKFSEVVSPNTSSKVKEFCPHLGL